MGWEACSWLEVLLLVRWWPVRLCHSLVAAMFGFASILQGCPARPAPLGQLVEDPCCFVGSGRCLSADGSAVRRWPFGLLGLRGTFEMHSPLPLARPVSRSLAGRRALSKPKWHPKMPRCIRDQHQASRAIAVSIVDFPTEVIYHVLDYLPATASARLAKSCRFLRAASRDETYWVQRFKSYPHRPGFIEGFGVNTILIWMHCVESKLCVECMKPTAKSAFSIFVYPICKLCVFEKGDESGENGLISVTSMSKTYNLSPSDMPYAAKTVKSKGRFNTGTYYLHPEVKARAAELHGSWQAVCLWQDERDEKRLQRRDSRSRLQASRKAKFDALFKKTNRFSQYMIDSYISNGKNFKALKERMERDYDFLHVVNEEKFKFSQLDYEQYRDELIQTPEQLRDHVRTQIANERKFTAKLEGLFESAKAAAEAAAERVPPDHIPPSSQDLREQELTSILQASVGITVADIKSQSSYSSFASNKAQVSPHRAVKQYLTYDFTRNPSNPSHQGHLRKLVHYIVERHMWIQSENKILRDGSEPEISISPRELRTRLIDHGLEHRGLSRRSDSKLCMRYIEQNTNISLFDVVQRMCEMHMLFEVYHGDIQNYKAMHLTSWREEFDFGSFEKYVLGNKSKELGHSYPLVYDF
ncbi:uncharacterized protein BJ171DRAFT_476584 [Polychytrium aggregatum]|uniref:uncharacterized protein n=1 Tax=Polychytrium aggregatum TaxID=110093 RepID=UPI0022FEC139|nr:uncharacterized protein BJ171DRAFT_476584 [Polychytrium aggregatum]KAI9202579.1 hypothetical protein BJ171DRAFT_476584 [Polychytrium aggregatum]